jgi:hypothetical protein
MRKMLCEPVVDKNRSFVHSAYLPLLLTGGMAKRRL